MGRVAVIDHPLIQHKLSIIRNVDTGPKEFRELVEEISLLMGYEVTRDMPLEDRSGDSHGASHLPDDFR